MDPYPLISIIIPVRPGASAKTAIDSIRKADYPLERIETILEEGLNPSRQRNQGIKKASGEILFFLDDDSEITPGLFKETVKTYQAYPDAIGVGGPAVLYGNTNLQKGVIAVLTSYLGVYKISARYAPAGQTRYTDENELISCNLSLKREIFRKNNGFNDKLYPNEENELIQSLIKQGYRFIYNPDCQILRQADNEIEAFLRRIFNYGRGRMEQLFLRPSKTSFFRLLPLGFLIYLSGLLFIPNPYLYLPFFGYLILIAVVSACASKKIAFGDNSMRFSVALYTSLHHKKQLKIIPLLIALFLATHILYGLGEVYGIYTALKHKRNVLLRH
ncbi:MAG TPA: glycosyltransferase [Candidatus Omnitrophota bacterium]|nr:glycosyltransferase [Candidatus Omnitrophota bacterium]